MSRPQDSPEVVERFTATLDLVDIIARQVGRAIGRSVDLDELKSYGREGLLDASRRYDSSRGVPFRAYANYRIRGRIMDGVRSLTRLPRRTHARISAWDCAARTSEGALEDLYAALPPGFGLAEAEQALADHLGGMATAMAIGLVTGGGCGEDGEPASVDGSDDPEAALAQAELMRVVIEALEGLGREEAELIRRHYLLGERFDHVAEELGLSKSWASRLHTRAIRRLSRRLHGAVE